MDVVALLIEDHRRISLLFDDVSTGDMTAVPEACDALLRYSLLEEEVLYPAVAESLEGVEWDIPAALDDHMVIRGLIADLADESSITPSYATRMGNLLRLVRVHARAEEDSLFPQIERAMNPQAAARLADSLRSFETAQPRLDGSLDRSRNRNDEAPSGDSAQADEGASSDGDASWVEAPLTQDPEVDRSVEAVIRRTQGL